MKNLLIILIIVCAAFEGRTQQNEQSKDSLTTVPLGKIQKFNSPLYILDDKEIQEHELSALKPEDIESIEVLKDSAATSPYDKRFGDRARKGVVLINMKKKKVNQN